MKVLDTPHSAWICANKNNGFMVTAYCTCVAGLVLINKIDKIDMIDKRKHKLVFICGVKAIWW